MNSLNRTLIIVGGCLLVAIVVAACLFTFERVHGDELGVFETYTGGVDPTARAPRVYFFPRWNRMVTYKTSSQIFVMNDKSAKEHGEKGEGREKDAYKVQSAEGQDMTVSMNLRWRREPTKVVALHKNVGPEVEERLIRPALMRVVKDAATVMKATDAYSGDGLVQLQKTIESRLTAKDFELADAGVIIENFVIEHISLDPKYIEQIQRKQVAIQKELAENQEAKAATAAATRAKAEAQADYEKRVVEATRDKEVQVKKAEAEQQTTVLAAKAEAEKTIVAAEAQAKQVGLAATAEANKTVIAAQAKKTAAENEAAAILAVGQAEAAAKKLQMTALEGAGAERFVQIEVSKSLAQAYSGIKGYLPSDMKVTTLTTSFTDALSQFCKPAPEAKK